MGATLVPIPNDCKSDPNNVLLAYNMAWLNRQDKAIHQNVPRVATVFPMVSRFTFAASPRVVSLFVYAISGSMY